MSAVFSAAEPEIAMSGGWGPTSEAAPPYNVLAAALDGALAREHVLLRRLESIARRQELQSREFNHRLFNSLQMIASLLSQQSRTASPPAAAELAVAVSRILAFGQVHRRLHLLDTQETVQFAPFLHDLCADLSQLLLRGSSIASISVEAEGCELPAAMAIPLGFIVNELITNAVKHAEGQLTVRLALAPDGVHTLSVSDQGAGLPHGFDPARSKRLGMRIVQSLVADIGGELLISAGAGGIGSCFAVSFRQDSAVHDVAPTRPSPTSSVTTTTLDSSDSVRRWITEVNIEQFNTLIDAETDSVMRAIFVRLLAAEQDKQKNLQRGDDN